MDSFCGEVVLFHSSQNSHETSADLCLPKASLLASTAAWLRTVPLRSFHFAASSQYGKKPENRTSTPHFLDNTLLNTYLDQMDSRWREQASRDTENWKWGGRLQVSGVIGRKAGQVLENWQCVVDAMPRAHIWTKMKQRNRRRPREKRKLT